MDTVKIKFIPGEPFCPVCSSHLRDAWSKDDERILRCVNRDCEEIYELPEIEVKKYGHTSHRDSAEQNQSDSKED
jgi:hypothetical protein